MTNGSHGWCEGGAAALNVVTTGDLGVWRRVSQAPSSAVVQLPVNYLAQQAGSLSARWAEEEDKTWPACLADDGVTVEHLSHTSGVWGSSDASVRGKRPRCHNSRSYLAAAHEECCMFGDRGSLVKKWRSVDVFFFFTRILQSASTAHNYSPANSLFILPKNTFWSSRRGHFTLHFHRDSRLVLRNFGWSRGQQKNTVNTFEVLSTRIRMRAKRWGRN